MPFSSNLNIFLLGINSAGLWERTGVVVSALDFSSEGQWFDAQSLPLCCFLRQETLPHIVSHHPGYKMGYQRHTAGGNPAMDWQPIRGGGVGGVVEVAVLSVASCYRNQGKLGCVGLLGSCATLPINSGY